MLLGFLLLMNAIAIFLRQTAREDVVGTGEGRMTLVDEKPRYRPMDAVRTQPADDAAADSRKIRARDVSVFYGDKQALFGIYRRHPDRTR